MSDPRIRCHECGLYFDAKDCVRRDVVTGGGGGYIPPVQGGAGGGYISSSQITRVDFCQPCIKVYDKRLRTQEAEHQEFFKNLAIMVGYGCVGFLILSIVLTLVAHFSK